MTGRSPDEAAASGSPASAVTSNGAPATDSRDAGGFRAQPAALHPREVPRHGAAGRRTAGHDGPAGRCGGRRRDRAATRPKRPNRRRRQVGGLELREIDVGEEAHVGSQPVLHGDEALAGERFGERGAGAPSIVLVVAEDEEAARQLRLSAGASLLATSTTATGRCSATRPRPVGARAHGCRPGLVCARHPARPRADRGRGPRVTGAWPALSSAG
jgi:hypothetical protein